MENNMTTFWNLLKKYNIEIPIIQRDYAQGRPDKKYIREKFLKDLKEALDEGKNLTLDFVYGSNENRSNENDKFQPLDGQQRLTTLWLLHWFIALKTKEQELSETFKILQKFTYETRITSREFCKELCTAGNFEKYKTDTKIVYYIENSTWFYSAWKQDPTIQSMLNTLTDVEKIFDKDEKIFDKDNGYWKKLTGANAPIENAPITFLHLPLDKFGLSDDLYIKMNARGKPLTSFENFKADLIGYIKEKANDKEWKELLYPIDTTKEGFPIKLDTTWTDIFWKNRSTDNRIDEIYFAFINNFFWNELFIAKDNGKYILDIGKGEENSSYKYLNNQQAAYNDFSKYKYFKNEIPLEFFKKLQVIFDNLSAIPECSWEKDFYFIPIYEKGSVTRLKNYKQRIVFFAVCKYFSEGEADDTSLKRWMRVVWNLVSGEDEEGKSEIRSMSDIRKAIEFIGSLESHDVYNSLKEKSHDVYNSLKEKSVDGNTAFDERCKEEVIKAEKIIEKSCWEAKIIEAENYAFFKGAIRFLYTNEKGEVKWSDFKKKFDNAQNYFNNAKNYFGNDGVKDFVDNDGVKYNYKTDALLLRNFISFFKEWGLFWNIKYDNSKEAWKSILLNEKWKEPVHFLLMSESLMPESRDFKKCKLELNTLPENYKEKIYENKQKEVQEIVVKTDFLIDVYPGSELDIKEQDDKHIVYYLRPKGARADWKIRIIDPVIETLKLVKDEMPDEMKNKLKNFALNYSPTIHDRWGRIGIDFHAKWHPIGLFAGVLYDFEDHQIEPLVKGSPDLVIIVDINYDNEEYEAFIKSNRAKAIKDGILNNHSDFDMLCNNLKNKYRFLILRKSLQSVIGDNVNSLEHFKDELLKGIIGDNVNFLERFKGELLNGINLVLEANTNNLNNGK